jgi:hypothetical protein
VASAATPRAGSLGAAVLVLGTVGFVAVAFGVDTRSCSGVRADVEDFREARRHAFDEDPPTRAQRIADGLIRCRTLRGLDQRGVARLLGRPDDAGRSADVDLADRRWTYTIGPWRGWFPIDYELLAVGYDGRGRVRRVWIVQS